MEKNLYFKREVFVIQEKNFYKEIILELLNEILLKSYLDKVSDIHIESQENNVRIRMRVDGTLYILKNIEKDLGIKLISKLKILSELDIGEKRLPQDGRFKGIYLDEKLDYRVSIVPTIFGEKCVIRILKNNLLDLDLNKLGFSKLNLDILYGAIGKKSGLILCVGPTGSGKTTTLYSIINYLNKENLNIVTIEDPIEYQLNGINQIQYKKEIGLDFSEILKRVLRQDPDVILIGEIRDIETAKIALTASLTGHLVLTTLHTRDSISTIERLLGFGIEPYIIASGLSLIQSQRLLRKICVSCKGIGCNECLNGFNGREAVEEVIVINDKIRSFILENKGTEKMKEYLISQNFISLIDNGKQKIKNGITTEEELNKECLL